jgi:hypothetical protein
MTERSEGIYKRSGGADPLADRLRRGRSSRSEVRP